MKSLITLLSILLIPIFSFSQNANFDKLDSLFNILDQDDRFFASAAISKGGEVIYSKSIGYADWDKKLRNNENTKFRIGSISKTFTATLIMKAVELGYLDLDEKIDDYFPRLSNSEKITVRQLLNHRSGISNFTDRNYFSWHTEELEASELLDTIINKGVDFAPNTDYAYSNSNYVLLTFILEKVFQDSYNNILHDHIVSVLGLENTHYGTEINTSKNEAVSYRMKSEWEEQSQDNMSIPLGAGGIVSTPKDLCVFIEGLFKGRLISKESLEDMKPVGDASYGFAIYGSEFAGQNGWGHGGNIDAFASNVTYFEGSDMSIAISCNGSNFGMHDVELAMLSEFFNEAYELPSFESVELTSEELEQYLGTYKTEELPIDLVVSSKENVLYLEATGQSASALTAKGNHKFEVTQYGVKMEFQPREDKLIFQQSGMTFELSRASNTEVLKEPQEISEETGGDVNLEKYVGVYESSVLPIDLKISIDGENLIGQGDGQPSFTLTSEGEHKYSNKEIGLTITFIPEANKMSFEQGGANFEMNRKNGK